MKTKEELIEEFESFAQWAENLQSYDPSLLYKPIGPGKWSVSEILSHILFWDRFMIEEFLPQVKPGADIPLVEFEPL